MAPSVPQNPLGLPPPDIAELPDVDPAEDRPTDAARLTSWILKNAQAHAKDWGDVRLILNQTTVSQIGPLCSILC